MEHDTDVNNNSAMDADDYAPLLAEMHQPTRTGSSVSKLRRVGSSASQHQQPVGSHGGGETVRRVPSALKPIDPAAQLSVASTSLNPLHSPNARLRVAKSPRSRSRESSARSASEAPSVEVSVEEVVAEQHRLDAERAARAALADDYEEPEINLTLWEQAAWNVKLYAVAESGSFPSDVPVSVDRAALLVAFVTGSVILLSCASILALSYPVYVTQSSDFWSRIEVFCVVVFTIDMLARLITCPDKKKFMYDLFNWVDIISILPFYVGLFGSDNFPWYLRIIRALRIARLVKVLKSRGILGLKALLNTIQDSVTGVILFFIVAGTGMLIFSTMMYFSERGVYDENIGFWMRPCTAFQNCTHGGNFTVTNATYLNASYSGKQVSPFQSIAGSFWFTISTMTTTGTGEIEGTSTIGRFVTGMMSFAGIFYIGVPTMIIAGNHIAAKVQLEITIRNTWTDMMRRKRRILQSTMGSLDLVRRYFSWSSAGDSRWVQLQEDDDETAELGGSAGGLVVAIPTMQGPADAVSANQQQHRSLVVGLYRSRGLVRQVRMNMVDSNELLYEPLLTIARDEHGRPKGTVVWANNGQSTLVRFDVILDDPVVRKSVAELARNINPNARIRCDAQSGLIVQHSSPLDALRTQVIGPNGEETVASVTRWTMLEAFARPGYREFSFPIYFRRTGGDWDDPYKHQDDEEHYSEKDIVDDCLASLLGSGLLIECFIPIPPVRRRVMIVQQFLQKTKLHRELELCAHRAMKDVAFEDLAAFISESDFLRLIEGVARRAELVDPGLVVHDLEVVERQIVAVLLRRLRRMRIAQVPAVFRRCIFNAEVLSADDLVYEVPMTLFVADEDDEVEQDSMGYVELTARSAFGRAERIDFSVAMSAAHADTTECEYFLSAGW